MAEFISIALRGAVLFWTLLITALIGNVIAQNINSSTRAITSLNFTMFVAALSWVAGLYGLAAAIFSAFFIPIAMIALDVLAVIFTFIAAVLLSARLGAPNCGNISNESHSSKWIAFGSNHTEKRCREIQASIAFLWFLWACFCACLFFTWQQGKGSFGMARASRPSMAQVRA
jgi:hypothetical protein